MTALITWFFRSKLGNAVGLALVIAACWYGFRGYYMREGAEKCRSEVASAVAAANVKLIEGERKRDSTSSTVASETTKNVEKAKADVTQSTNKTKDAIQDEYRAPITAPAVALGSCAYPLRPGVQKHLDTAVREANAADSSM